MLATPDPDIWSLVASEFAAQADPPPPRWATPGDLAKAIDPTTVQTPALDLIDDVLVKVEAGLLDRVIISMPPQEGKSTRVTKTGPLWFLSRHPHWRIGIVSYSSDLAEQFGRDIRQMINQNAGQDGTLDLGMRLAPDNGSISDWKLSGTGGGVRSVGLTGGLTGRRADLLVIDDPLSNREQAESRIYRDRAKSFWTSTAGTRLSPGAPVIVVLTRWHEDDLAGWLLGREDAHRWHVVNIPAQANHRPELGETDPLGREPGEYMISARTNERTGQSRTVAEWEQIKIQAGSRDWNALYMGRPSPESGDILQRQWFRRYETRLWSVAPDGSHHLPDGWTVAMSWDCTFKAHSSTDYVAGQVWAVKGAQAYLVDQTHARMTFTETTAAIQAQAKKWPQTRLILIEDAANGPAIIDTLKQKVPGIVPVKPRGSKEARASAVAPYIEAGNVLLPADHLGTGVDIDGLIDEAASFPNSPHDDRVDALSMALDRLLSRAGASQAWLAAWRRRQAAAAVAEPGDPDTPATEPVGEGSGDAPTLPAAPEQVPAPRSWRDRGAHRTAPPGLPATRPPLTA